MSSVGLIVNMEGYVDSTGTPFGHFGVLALNLAGIP